MDDEQQPPVVDQPVDRSAPRDAFRLALPPLVFLAHFGGIYGLAGLACAFRWDVGAGEVFVKLMLTAVTVIAVALVWWSRPRAMSPPGKDMLDPYDPAERRHFMAGAARATSWLAIAAMLLVTLPVFLSRTCTVSP